VGKNDGQHNEERNGEDGREDRCPPRQRGIRRRERQIELPRSIGVVSLNLKLTRLLLQLFDFDLRLGEDFLAALGFELLELARRVGVRGDGFADGFRRVFDAEGSCDC
jgi:hypothetical protein